MITRAEAGQADLATVKEHLRIPFVMEDYGYSPSVQDHRALSYHSPFRDDDHPSFDVFYHTIANREESEERWGDRGETGTNGRQGTQGDVIDLIQRFDGSNRTNALSKARELLQKQIAEEWDGPTITQTEKPTLSLDNITTLVDLGRPLTHSPLTWDTTLNNRPGLIGALLPAERVFLHPEHDTIVFLLADENGDIRGARFRGDDGSKWTMSGSANILLRLSEPQPDFPVLLTEGETDTWAAWTHLGDEYEVLGVPGVGNPPSTLGGEYLAGRTVYIAFDPDDAGRGARDQWTEYLIGIGAEVRIIVVPTGKDIAKLYPEEIAALPSQARHVPPPPDGFIRQGSQFGVSSNTKQGEPVFAEKTNWAFIPTSILIGESGERSYSGRLLPHNIVTTLPAVALTSASGLRSWGAPHQCRWYGSDAMVQQLAALLDHEAALLPEGRVTDQVGLYKGNFVWDGGSLGQGDVHYVEGEASPGYTDTIHLEEAPVDPIAVFEAMYSTQLPGVTTPILAWLAAAPIRSTLHQFPILSVTGPSGSGKTTLSEELASVFSGSRNFANLTSSTAYGVEVMLDTSNGFPLVFDEYRPGAREDAKNRLDQLIRDAYTGQESRKGGSEGNRSRVRRIRTLAPIIVSGEDSFTETSHTDRMVLVNLTADGRGDLDPLLDLDTRGFAYAYLRSLLEADTSVEEPAVFRAPDLPPSGYALRPRQEANARVLTYGWNLLTSFLQSFDPEYQMPDLDLSLVVQAGQEAGRTNPVLELVHICLENNTLHPTVWEQDGKIMVSTPNLVREAKNHPSIVLPTTTAKGLTSFLIAEHGGEQGRVAVAPSLTGSAATKQMRVVMLDRSVVDLTENDNTDTEI